jgi:hypothetical protein
MKLAVFGPKTDAGGKNVLSDVGLIAPRLDLLDISEIYTGGGQGVERLAEQWAKDKGIPYKVVPPNIELFGKDDIQHAFDLRNTEIINHVDGVIVFWSVYSVITIRVISQAAAARKWPILVSAL